MEAGKDTAIGDANTAQAGRRGLCRKPPETAAVQAHPSHFINFQ